LLYLIDILPLRQTLQLGQFPAAELIRQGFSAKNQKRY
jgi:hypothetical protein